MLQVLGATASAEGLLNGVNELEAIPAEFRSSLRVILFFSDGAPNLINGRYYQEGGKTTVEGNLYSETSQSTMSGCTATMGACRMLPRNQRAGPETWYTSPAKVITHLPLEGSRIGNKGVALASHDGRRALDPATGQSMTDYPYQNTRCNVNRAARNMVERIANDARERDIRIYTIGLGDALNGYEGITYCGYNSAEYGSAILKRLANTVDSGNNKPNQPQGLYCHAATASDLNRCFSSIASEILRLTI